MSKVIHVYCTLLVHGVCNYREVTDLQISLHIDTCYKPTCRYIKDLHDQDFKYPEVLFPDRFTNQQPWSSESGYQPDPQPATIPIFHLSHITHNEQAEAIHPPLSENFTFRPQAKVGKAYGQRDGTPLGETYRETQVDSKEYFKIPRSENNPVFPGFLSWWGIDVREWYHPTAEKPVPRLLEIVRDNHMAGQYVPGYLAEDTGSPYGNRAFSISLADILSDYKGSRNDCRGAEVCLKVGGTLRYRYEICYVVVVCMDGDTLGTMPNIENDTGPFSCNGLVGGNGMVIDDTKTPEFRAQSIVKTVKNGFNPVAKQNVYDLFSWEQLVFAFYFPDPGQGLQCTNGQQTEVQHNPPTCTSKRPPPDNQLANWNCPNKY